MENRKNVLIGIGILLFLVGVYYLYHKRHKSHQNVKIQNDNQSGNQGKVFMAMKAGQSKGSTVQTGLQSAQEQTSLRMQKVEKAQEKSFGNLLSKLQ